MDIFTEGINICTLAFNFHRYKNKPTSRYLVMLRTLNILGYNEFPHYELYESVKQTLIYEPL